MKKELVFRKDKTIFQENTFPNKDFRPPENVGRYKLSHSRPDRQATYRFPNNLPIQFPTARNINRKHRFTCTKALLSTSQSNVLVLLT